MSDKQLNENPLQTNLQRLKSQGNQVDPALAGLNIPMLQKALAQVQAGQQLSGQYSKQLGMFLGVINPIMSDGGALQQLISLSQRAQRKQNPAQDPDSNYRADRMDNVDVELDDSIDLEVDGVDLSDLREDAESMIFLTENPVSMAILGQYLDPKDANLVTQAMRRFEAGEGISGQMGQAVAKYMQVVTDFLNMGGAGLSKLKQTAKSFLGKEIGKKEEEPEMEPNMQMDEPEMKKEESMDLSDLMKLAGLNEGLGYAMPQEENEGSVSFSQEKNTDKGSVSIEANADNMEELAKIMKLAGLELPNMQQASADDEEPEQEELLIPQEEEKCDDCGKDVDDCECPGHDHDEEDDAPCGDDEEQKKPKMIVVSPAMDKSSLFNSLKAKLQDKLSS
tara:strand:- start:2138 stop:3316 length:1179 start_codon:yes stop_codon:yes gene_type:complete